MLPAWNRRGAGQTRCFNPHPARRPGCSSAGSAAPCPSRTRFNPHPARRPGAPAGGANGQTLFWEFQSSPGPKAGCSPAAVRQRDARVHVSILTRPEGRVLLAATATTAAPCLVFQSSPGPKAGCSVLCHGTEFTISVFQSSPGPKAGCSSSSIAAWRRRSSSFNPHPARRPGAPDTLNGSVEEHEKVSILTRPEGRVLLMLASDEATTYDEFQSSPGPKAGCSLGGVCRHDVGDHVSILTRPEGRVLLATAAVNTRFNPVSILTRPEGRVLRRRVRAALRRPDGFNPHPARRPGAPATLAVLLTR